MRTALVTGSAGLIGAEACRFLAARAFRVLGIDNDSRRGFFGEEASTAVQRLALEQTLPDYRHHDFDVRDTARLEQLVAQGAEHLELVIHAAAQPSHDWAAGDPTADFAINAQATLVLLEAVRRHAPQATFVFMSTNKVYGDRPNQLPTIDAGSRWELVPDQPFAAHGFDETLSVDQSLHSLFGASKLAADIVVQEYGRYFGLHTVCFRGGCITGPEHASVVQHGFLAYLARCAAQDREYEILGYDGKQVRDILHARDLVAMFWQFHLAPRPGEVYNVGGGRRSNCSVREAVTLCQELTGRPLRVRTSPQERKGDHRWWISDTRKFEQHYPDWAPRYSLRDTLAECLAAHGALARR